MRNKLIKVLGLTAAFTAVAGLACSAEEAKKVIAINPWVSLSVFMNSDEGFKDAAEDLGLDLEIAANAVEELGLEGITILAIDDNDDTVQYIKDSKIWATMAQNFYKMGYQSAVAVDAYLKGETVETTYDSGTVLITAENADNYTFD